MSVYTMTCLSLSLNDLLLCATVHVHFVLSFLQKSSRAAKSEEQKKINRDLKDKFMT